MATFSNRATLNYNGTTTDSNIAYGELLEVLTATKTALGGAYTPGEPVTYVVTLRNTGATALTGLVLTDNLGAYTQGTAAVYPLTYEGEAVGLFVNGAAQPTPAVTAGPPMVITGINIPAGGDAVLVYQARANQFADPGVDGTIENTVTMTGAGLTAPITAAAIANATQAPSLSIDKSISPTQVVDNDRVTYTFVIRNTGNTPVEATENATITDVLDPILTDLVVTYNGANWTQGTQYSYDVSTGRFATLPGQLAVPAATYAQDTVTGAYIVNPGSATLTITGTI